MQITLRYDGYNRQFKLIDRPASCGLEDGRTYVMTTNDEGTSSAYESVQSTVRDAIEDPCGSSIEV